MQPIKLKSLLAVSVSAFIIYSIYLYLTTDLYLHYDGKWWFESTDKLQIIPTVMFVTTFPGVVGLYGGYHFLRTRQKILAGTIKSASNKIIIGVIFVWMPGTVLGLFLLEPMIAGVLNSHDPAAMVVQNFIFVPLAFLFTLNLPGMLSLYAFARRSGHHKNKSRI